MPKLIIKGNFTPGSPPAIDHVILDGDCQTCGVSFDIAIPYDLHATSGTVQHVLTTAKSDATGKRTITGT